MDINFKLDNRFKNIANGMTAFCIFGGPSTNQVKNIDELIKNNFTVVVNNGIKFYKPDPREEVKLVSPDNLDQLIDLLYNEAKVL